MRGPRPLPAKTCHREQAPTDQTQPYKLELRHCHNGKRYPQHRLREQRQPEEALVCRVDGARVRVRRLKDPVRAARGGVDLVPPSQPDEAAAGDVLEVVEVRGQEEDGYDEDEDA